MIHLAFSLPDPGARFHGTWDRAKQVDSATIDEFDLRYYYFEADVEMTFDGVKFISNFVPLVDLALCIRGVIDKVSQGEDGTIGFTENDEVISFRRSGGRLLVSSSHRDNKASVDRDELLKEFSKFLQSTYSRIVEEIPKMADNPTVARLSADSQS